MHNADMMNGAHGGTPQDLENEIARLRTMLIEQEKLASIGHLTAGILHEIRNPLNFIINFSKVSAELMAEMQDIFEKSGEKLANDDRDDIRDINADVQANLIKVTENGERAMRTIVNMLARSRDHQTCELELTDLNQLVDDMVKLAYQGMRGNDHSFNMGISTRFDPAVGLVNLDAHDLGRAILNMINNAAYAMNSKKLQCSDDSYKALLTVFTKRTSTGIMISIKDNGTGIPGSIKDKVFTPFFTTKPGREGTGLGLSMTKDIICDIHKGTLDIHSADGEYTEFVINIPITTTSH